MLKIVKFLCTIKFLLIIAPPCNVNASWLELLEIILPCILKFLNVEILPCVINELWFELMIKLLSILRL